MWVKNSWKICRTELISQNIISCWIENINDNNENHGVIENECIHLWILAESVSLLSSFKCS